MYLNHLDLTTTFQLLRKLSHVQYSWVLNNESKSGKLNEKWIESIKKVERTLITLSVQPYEMNIPKNEANASHVMLTVLMPLAK